MDTEAKSPIDSELINSNNLVERKLVYASFWERVFSRLIDSILLGIFQFILFTILNTDPNNRVGYGMLLSFLVYFPLMEWKGGTLGKQAIGLITLDIKTKMTPSFGQALRRSLFLIGPIFLISFLAIPIILIFPNNNIVASASFTIIGLAMLCFLVGAPLAVLWTQFRQGWHDKFADIIVVTRKSYFIEEKIQQEQKFTYQCIHCNYEGDVDFIYCPECGKNDAGELSNKSKP